MDTINKVFTKLQFLFQITKQSRISAFFKQSCLIIFVTVSGYKEEQSSAIMQPL